MRCEYILLKGVEAVKKKGELGCKEIAKELLRQREILQSKSEKFAFAIRTGKGKFGESFLYLSQQYCG